MLPLTWHRAPLTRGPGRQGTLIPGMGAGKVPARFAPFYSRQDRELGPRKKSPFLNALWGKLKKKKKPPILAGFAGFEENLVPRGWGWGGKKREGAHLLSLIRGTPETRRRVRGESLAARPPPEAGETNGAPRLAPCLLRPARRLAKRPRRQAAAVIAPRAPAWGSVPACEAH